MRLIDADVLLEEFRKEMDKSIFEGRSVREVIDNAPTVDAVPVERYKSMENTCVKLQKALADVTPVVRCKDCKCWTEWANGTGSCNRFTLDWIGTDADDFCSMGERKDDEIIRHG